METLLTCSLLGPLASACVYDLRERRIPNKLVGGMAVLWCVLCAAMLCLSDGAQDAWTFVKHSMIGAVTLGGGALMLGSIFERVLKRTSLGGGDVKLLFVIGLYLGVFGGLLCLLVACVAAVVLSFVVPHSRFAHVPGSVAGGIPFAPALFTGALFAVCTLL